MPCCLRGIVCFLTFFMMKFCIFPSFLLLALSACTTFSSKPLDLDADEQAWLALSQQQAGRGKLNLIQARQVGLSLNPALNEARQKYRNSEEIAWQSGWWSDPAVSWDGMHVFGDSPERYTVSAGLDLTIPVTGLPALEKAVANQYKEADYWALRQTEADFLVQLEQAWGGLYVAHKKLILTDKRLGQLKEEEQTFMKLVGAGELVLTVQQSASARINDVEREKQAAQRACQEEAQKVVKLLGLHPRALGKLFLDVNASILSPVSVPTPSQLTQVPQLLSKMAQYGATESTLKAEIRKQYPEIQVGPRFDREEGANRVGLGLGFDLPLWNRNRKAIAEATGARESAYGETLHLWRNLLTQAQQWGDQQKMLSQHISAEQGRLSQYEGQLGKLEKLQKIGEASLQEVAETRQQAYESSLALWENQGALISLHAQIRNLVPAQQLNTNTL